MTIEQFNAALAIRQEIAQRQEKIAAIGSITISDENATVATGIAFIDAKVVPGLLSGLKGYAQNSINSYADEMTAQVAELETQFANL